MRVAYKSVSRSWSRGVVHAQLTTYVIPAFMCCLRAVDAAADCHRALPEIVDGFASSLSSSTMLNCPDLSTFNLVTLFLCLLVRRSEYLTCMRYPTTFCTQDQHASAEDAMLLSRAVTMATRRSSNQVIECALSVHDTHSGRIKMNGTVGLYESDCRFNG